MHIPIADCVDGALYMIHARNSSFGIFREGKGFQIYVNKFGRDALDFELHWDTSGKFGTAKPSKLIEMSPEFPDTPTGKKQILEYLIGYSKGDESMMGAVFLDIDGTVIDWATGAPVANAVETVNKWHRMGIQVILTTRRGHVWPKGSPFSTEATEKLLEDIGLKYQRIVYDVHSPRLVINDEGAGAINHPASKGWDYPDYPFDIGAIRFGSPPAKYGIVAIVDGVDSVKVGFGRKRLPFFTLDSFAVTDAMALMGYGPESYRLSKFMAVSPGVYFPPDCERDAYVIKELTEKEFQDYRDLDKKRKKGVES